MNIGLFTDTYFPQVSGVATSIQTLRRQLEANGHKVYIFTSTDPKVKKGTLEPNIYRFASLPFVGFKDRRITYRGAIQAVQLAKKLQLDIVHTQTEFSLGVMGKFVARQLKIPVVHTFHTNYEDYLHYIANGKIIRPGSVAVIARNYMAGMTGIISPSRQTYDTLMKYKVKAPIEIIPTGVNVLHSAAEDTSIALREKLGLKPETPVVLSLGRVAFEKNLDDALSVFAEALEEVPDAMFIIVGGGPAMSALQEHVSALEIDDHVIFTGEVNHNDVYGYYKMGDVFVSCILRLRPQVRRLAILRHGQLCCMRLTNEHLVNASLISMQKHWLFTMKRRIRKLPKQTMWSTQKHSCFGIHSDEMIND